MARMTWETALKKNLVTRKQYEAAKRKRARQQQWTPQLKLWQAVKEEWPHEAVAEFVGAVPGRKYRLDIAFPQYQIGIEVDGWRSHGLSKYGFKRDREKDIYLNAEGWQVMRFTTSHVLRDMQWCLEMIRKAIQRRQTNDD